MVLGVVWYLVSVYGVSRSYLIFVIPHLSPSKPWSDVNLMSVAPVDDTQQRQVEHFVPDACHRPAHSTSSLTLAY
jgi:hypothetical protein